MARAAVRRPQESELFWRFWCSGFWFLAEVKKHSSGKRGNGRKAMNSLTTCKNCFYLLTRSCCCYYLQYQQRSNNFLVFKTTLNLLSSDSKHNQICSTCQRVSSLLQLFCSASSSLKSKTLTLSSSSSLPLSLSLSLSPASPFS